MSNEINRKDMLKASMYFYGCVTHVYECLKGDGGNYSITNTQDQIESAIDNLNSAKIWDEELGKHNAGVRAGVLRELELEVKKHDSE